MDRLSVISIHISALGVSKKFFSSIKSKIGALLSSEQHVQNYTWLKAKQLQDDDDVSITDDVRGADYYHGLIPKTDVEPLLKKEGDFLLRKTELKPGTLL